VKSFDFGEFSHPKQVKHQKIAEKRYVVGYLLSFFKTARPRELLFFSGYALYLVFSYMVIHSATVLSSVGELGYDTQTLFWLFQNAARVFVFVAIICCVRFVMRTSVTLLAVAAAVTVSMGFLITGMVFQFSSLVPADMALPWLLLGSILLATGDALIVMLWARLSATLELRDLYLYVLLSNMLSLVVYFLVTLLPEQSSIPVAVAIFVASAVFVKYALALREQQQWEYSLPVFKRAVRGVAQPLIGTMILFFMSGLMQQITRQRELPLSEFQQISLLTSAVVVLCLLLPALLVRKPFNIARIYTLAVPLSAAGFLLLPLIWNAAGGIVNSLAQLGSMVAAIVLWCVLADMTRDTKLPPVLLFAIALACTDAAMLAGSLVGFMNADTLQQGDIALTTVALVAAYLLFMVAIFLFKDKSSKDREGEPPTEVVHVDALLPHRCEKIAKGHRLTSRECEIFILLAQGYTIPVISEKLFVSENTIKSHVKSIYQKLEIHTRSDLIEMVNTI
jgi:DNA-binding CsgD family transcriptional regulator